MLAKYILSIDPKFAENGEELGIFEIANTANPAIMLKGVAFSSQETKRVYFADELKYRIAAPVIIPGDIYRKDEETLEEYEAVVTTEYIESIYVDFMAKRMGGQVFNEEHNEAVKPPSYILETWLVDNPKTDKSKTVYGLDVPKGSWFAVQQFTDKVVYADYVKRGLTGFSIHGHSAMLLMGEQTTGVYGDVIVQNSDGKTLLLKRTDADKIEGGKYGFPGGKIEPNEEPEVGAIRELKEEAGIALSEVEHIKTISNEDGTTSHYYSGIVDSDDVTLSDEHVGFEWMTTEEIKDADIIFDGNDLYIELINSVNKTEMANKKTKLSEGPSAYMELPVGEHEIGGKIYTVEEVVEGAGTENEYTHNEIVTIVPAGGADTEMEEDEKKEDTELAEDETKKEDTELAEDEKKEDDVELAEDEEKKEEDTELMDDKEKDTELAEDAPGEYYSKEEVDAKFAEVFDMIADLKKGAEVEEEVEETPSVQMSAHDVRMSEQRRKLDAFANFTGKK